MRLDQILCVCAVLKAQRPSRAMPQVFAVHVTKHPHGYLSVLGGDACLRLSEQPFLPVFGLALSDIGSSPPR